MDFFEQVLVEIAGAQTQEERLALVRQVAKIAICTVMALVTNAPEIVETPYDRYGALVTALLKEMEAFNEPLPEEPDEFVARIREAIR